MELSQSAVAIKHACRYVVLRLNRPSVFVYGGMLSRAPGVATSSLFLKRLANAVERVMTTAYRG